MTDSFHIKNPLYPVFSIITSLVIFAGSLLLAKSFWGIIFLAAVFLLLVAFGYGRACFFMLPFTIIYVGIFSVIFYFASGRNINFAIQMAVRFGGVSLAAVPGLALEPVCLVRNLTELKCPRLVTLGMLITLSFIPVLAGEIKQVRGAMKSRGAASLWKPSVLYRAFLIPLIVRLVNISDTLTLSVETRGFVADDVTPSSYKNVSLVKKDIIFAFLFLGILTACIVFSILEKK
ncbi:energy-coupling factor transporter transmembrane protein EcfT [Treponema sp.]|uniref:energy-coupling factor transporter transmembrane component T family protein n=1 Tax=Treponema sp. TaxID=166 RepID=UPI0025E27813|nr:energy-coupling factor transporter transmembrane component T [Treponema sp.]MCR5217068.1 energy-coupling factor transporter transmembrane protein EcfT [Treponema sp.]